MAQALSLSRTTSEDFDFTKPQQMSVAQPTEEDLFDVRSIVTDVGNDWQLELQELMKLAAPVW